MALLWAGGSPHPAPAIRPPVPIGGNRGQSQRPLGDEDSNADLRRIMVLSEVMVPSGVSGVRSRRSWIRVGFVCALLLPIVLSPQAAQAQTEEERAGARAVAMEGAQAFQDGKWQEALDRFGRAESLVHAPPHVLYMARCHEKLGQLVQARELFLQIIREKLLPSAPDAFLQAQRDAAKSLDAIEPRLARLTVRVEGPSGLNSTVTMDGKPVSQALVGVPRPVDPGQHLLQAKASGYESKIEKAELAEGASLSVTLKLEPVAGTTTPSVPGTPAQVGVGKPSSQLGTAESERSSSGSDSGKAMRIGSYAALGVGVVGAAVGTAFVLSSRSKRSEADSLDTAFRSDCGSACLRTDPRASRIDGLDSDARSAATLGVVGMVVGGVGLATGVTLFVLSRHPAKEGSSVGNGASARNRAEIVPVFGPSFTGVVGRF